MPPPLLARLPIPPLLRALPVLLARLLLPPIRLVPPPLVPPALTRLLPAEPALLVPTRLLLPLLEARPTALRALPAAARPDVDRAVSVLPERTGG